MELCKHCSEPILPRSDYQNQIYCSFKCWKAHRETPQHMFAPENEPSLSEWIQSQIIAWGSIIGMFAFLFVVLVSVATFVVNLQYFLMISTTVCAILVYFVLRMMHTTEQLNELLKIPKSFDTWKLIGIAFLIDIFVVKPLHILFTFYFFPDAENQEVITALKEMSQISAIITAVSVSILTPILEELLFRGFVLGMFLRCYSKTPAIILSAFIFAMVHEPIAIGMAFGGGLLYGWLRVRTGSIVPSMIAHMIWNSFISLIVLFY